MTNIKKLTALLLAVIMLMSIAAISAYAEDGDDEPAHEAGWYVVGSEEFFGTQWAEDIPLPQAKMEQIKGVWTATYTNAPVGSFTFKVVETTSIGAVKTWHPDGMGNDSSFTVTEEGSTVRFCLVPQTSNSNDKPYAEVFAPGEEIPEITEPTTASKPTTPPPTVPEGKIKVNVSSNIGKPVSAIYDTSLDSEITVDFKLACDNPIANIQGNITYDSDVLELEDFTLDEQFTSPVYNTGLYNKATFNHTNTDNSVDFQEEAVFLTAKFKILSTGITDVALNIEELNALSQSYDLYAIITDSAIAEGKEVSGNAALNTPTVPSEPSSETEPSVTEPTQPTTKAPALNVTKKTLKAGATYTIKVKNTTAKATFSSNKKTVATVSTKGKVTALKKGTATITVKVAGKKLTCKITVSSNPTAKISKKTIKTKYYTVKKKHTITVVLTGKASAINNVYKSSKSKIAKVVSNKKATKVKIKGLKKGKATITIKVNKVKTFKIKINVK